MMVPSKQDSSLASIFSCDTDPCCGQCVCVCDLVVVSMDAAGHSVAVWCVWAAASLENLALSCFL